MKWFFLLILSMLPAVTMGQAIRTEIVAHRGASHDAPENTLTSFKLGFEQHADAIEGDYYLTADEQIVCIHDPTTKRTSNGDLKVAASTLKQLRELDFGTWKDAKFASERIPTLAEVLAIVPAGKDVLLEIKCGPEIVPFFKATITASKLPAGQIRIISFNAEVIAACKIAMPEIKAFWLTGYKKDEATGQFKPSHDEVLETLKRIHADGLDSNANLEVLTPDFVKRLRDAKMEFHAWTVDDVEVARKLIDLGVDSITTNRPGWLREQVGITPR